MKVNDKLIGIIAADRHSPNKPEGIVIGFEKRKVILSITPTIKRMAWLNRTIPYVPTVLEALIKETGRFVLNHEVTRVSRDGSKSWVEEQAGWEVFIRNEKAEDKK